MNKQGHLTVSSQWPKKTAYGVMKSSWPGELATATQCRVTHSDVPSAMTLPRCLKMGMEAVTGVNLDDVRVHLNSTLPAQVNAHAYAQGQNIFLGPGQEHHLPHELGHVVQQALGMVQATTKVNGVAVNDDPSLEEHATRLGEKAMIRGGCEGHDMKSEQEE